MKLPHFLSTSYLATAPKRFLLAVAALALVLGGAPVVQADLIPYPDSGTYNATTYTFTAMATGEITAYFAGSTASYDNQLGMLVNGVSTGIVGLDNHTSAVGDSLDLGHVNAGDILTFVLQNNTLGADAYSNPALNLGYDNGPATGTADGHNHVYSTAYTATGPILDHIPVGTFVSFEDLRFPASDYNYNDEDFVFTNVHMTSATPEPSSALIVLLVGGLGGAGMMLKRRRSLGRSADAR